MSTPVPDRPQALSLVLDLLEVPTEAREARLAAIRAGDPVLAEEVARLLARHARLDDAGFLAQSVGLEPPPEQASLAGQVVGAYTLTSHIGEGGMGAVWRARRSDGRFESQVAVKLLKASLVGRSGEERFRREATILARLAHPAIAHLIDAGVSAGGQPFLVLEYVEGEHIDQYCDAHRLDIAARIRLFLDVLTAVAHAHANLVVHRDLKPSNVLAFADRSDDAQPAVRVKLLDFGIAKMLEADDGVSLLTQDSGWAATPAFAAPEQLTGGDVTTATDVYALGVLLYVLLSGRHPADPHLRSPADLIAAVVKTEPLRLSEAATRVSADADGDAVATAADRGTTPEKLRRLLAGDLETIVAKALKKSPLERYVSVGALADDLQRYLDERPITARPDTWRYRTAKFVRRNRLAVTLATLTLAAIGAGVAGTLTQARRADIQRQRADDEARIARAQRDFALGQVSRADSLNELNAFVLSEAAATDTPVRAVELLANAEQILGRDRQTNENHVEMLVALGVQYFDLNHYARARELLMRAYDRSHALADPGTRARAACALASAVAEGGDARRAEELVVEGARALPREPQYALHRAFCSLRGSTVAAYTQQGKTGVARALEALAVLKASGLASPMLELQIADALAAGYAHAGQHREMLAAYADVARRLTAMGRDDTYRGFMLYSNWGSALLIMGRPLEARPLLERAHDLYATMRVQMTAQQFVGNELASSLNELDRWQEAAEVAAATEAEARKAGNERVADSARLHQVSARRQLGDLARASALLATLEPHARRLPLPAHAVSPAFLARLAAQRSLLAGARGHASDALAEADRAIALVDAPRYRSFVARLLVTRSNLAWDMQRLAQARADAERATTLLRASDPHAVSCDLGRAQLALGRALMAEGSRAEAHAALTAAVDQLTPTLGADHAETRLARELAAATR